MTAILSSFPPVLISKTSTSAPKPSLSAQKTRTTPTSEDPNDPNVVAATVINGSNPPDPNIGSVVTFKNAEDANSVLTGFTITGGTGSWLLVSWQFKGLYWNRCGGGVLCYNMAQPTISKNVFLANTAGQGGALYVYGNPVDPNNPSNPPVHVRPQILDNTFIDNTAVIEHGFEPPDDKYPHNDHGDGGAIAAFQGCDLTIKGNLIKNNHAHFYGGGIHLRQWSNGIIENNQIIANTSELGAGIHLTYTSRPAVRNNLIKANRAGMAGGGGIYLLYSSSALIENNTIMQNQSRNGAGIAVFDRSHAVIRNNLICKNLGAAIKIKGGSRPQICHNTISDNITEHFEGAIDIRTYTGDGGTAPLIQANIITSNCDGYGILAEPNTSPIIRYNNIWNNKAGNYGAALTDQTAKNGNICLDPRFVNVDSNDYHLNFNSKCINAADPNFDAHSLTDYDGQPRRMGQFADIGADEASPVWNLTSQRKYSLIQTAVDTANDFDRIVVTRGRYFENINFLGKQITLTGPDPNDWTMVASTIIDANAADSVVTFSHTEGPNSILTGFTITGGNAFYGGGIKCEPAAPTITTNIIRNNQAGYKGGGIYCYGPTHQTAIISNNIIKDNHAIKAGALFCDTGTSVAITNNRIFNNSAAAEGGGVVITHKNTLPSAIVAGNLIAGNRADSAGGIACHSLSTLINNTIVKNRASRGAGILISGGCRHRLTNNLIAYNHGSGIFALTADPNTMPMIADITFNNCFANQGGNYDSTPGGFLPDQTGLNSNISLDPNLVAPGYWNDANTPADTNDDFFVYGNYHIPPDSPCLDKGDSNAVPALLSRDIDGETRLFADSVDIGADEVVTNPADFNYDGIVDFCDLAALGGEWLKTDNLHTDLHTDNFVDLRDYAELARQWLWQGGWHH